jgi:hypothetical protein
MRAQVRDDPRLAAAIAHRWSAEDLAHTVLSVITIRRAELMPSATALTRANDQAVRQARRKRGSGIRRC